MIQRPVQRVLDQTLLDLEREIGGRDVFQPPTDHTPDSGLIGFFKQLWLRILFGQSGIRDPAYEDQGYETRYTEPLPRTEKTSLRLEPNVAAALSYTIWIAALILFLQEKENRFIRFHAMQSILYHALWLVLMLVLWIMSAILAALAAIGGNDPRFVGLLSLVFAIIWTMVLLFYIGGLIFLAVKAYQGAIFEFPIVGNIAKKSVPAAY